MLAFHLPTTVDKEPFKITKNLRHRSNQELDDADDLDKALEII